MVNGNRVSPPQTTGAPPTEGSQIQQTLFGPCPGSPAARWSEEEARHALDELFNATAIYRKSKTFMDLVKFVKSFRFYSPFNSLLIHIQRPGATFVAPPHRWLRWYGRTIKPNATPIVILQPMGPVMFVFDVIDTEEGPNPSPLPPEVVKPFEAKSGKVGQELERTVENSKRDGVRILTQKAGSQAAGAIQTVEKKDGREIPFQTGKDEKGHPTYEYVPLRYEMLLNQDHSREARYATITHELGHLYCGHLGTPNKDWWPDRRGLFSSASEFEAESISYLVCGRMGIETPSDQYLAGYVKNNEKVPEISLECVMKAAGVIESMGKERLKPRKKER